MPRKWAQRYNVRKGDELDLEEQGNKVIITSGKGIEIQKAELDIDNLDPMVLRCITALYKKGVDEIKIVFSKPEAIASVQKAIGKEAVGFEITEQGKGFCIIKHVSGELEDFDSVLRRTFLLLNSMANECFDSLKKGDLENLKNVAFLEEANNRFTTTCRRHLNKKGVAEGQVGPIYCIIEALENIADEYKYLCNALYEMRTKKIKISPEILEFFKETNSMLQSAYEAYYSFDKTKISAIGRKRKQMVERMRELLHKSSATEDKLLIHHSSIIMQKIFCMTGPYLILRL